MTRITRALLASILLGLLSPGEVLAGEERMLASDEAWESWENGEIDEAQRRAGAIADANEGKALLFLSAAVKGRYEELGIANAFKLGDAVLENVPVAVLPSLSGSQDFIIFGTNVLEQFHSTLDYPRKRLILSPRDDDELRKRHMQMLPGRRVEMPFYLWADHYMFARGGFGDHRSLNFFIDSGLVKLGWSRLWLRQACFATTPALYKTWGVEEDAAESDLFQSPLPISLGELEQRDQFFTPTPELYASSFGGVRIDGLLSHAFLKRYAWTIDFDRGVYVFSWEGD